MSEDLIPHTGNTVPQIAEFVDGIDALKDPVTRRDYFEHMDGDSFLDMTQRVASLVRTGDRDQLQHFDGQRVGLMSHEVPDQREKEGLLRETWEVARGLLKDRNITDKDALEYAALTVAGGILLSHPFADGNGRTSRMLSYIIAEGGQDKETVEAIVSESLSTEWQVAPARTIMNPISYRYKGEQPQDIEWTEQFAGEAEDALDGKIAGSVNSDVIIRHFIDTADEKTRNLIEACAQRDDEGKLFSIDGDKLLEVLVNDPDRGMEYAQSLLDLRRIARAETVHRYLRAMKSNVPRTIRLDPARYMDNGKRSDEYRASLRTAAGIVALRTLDGKILPRDEAVAEHRGYSDFHVRRSPQS